MRLAWHIVRKDVRRMAPAVALWLVFIVATTAWFRFATLEPQGHVATSIAGNLAVMAIWSRLIVAAQFLVSFVLAGALVLEDSLVGTGPFWKTRPIANHRLLAAKAMGATLLFVVAPTVGLAAIWLAGGLGLSETGIAAGEFALTAGVITISAVGVAALSRNLPQFLLSSVLLAVAYFFSAIVFATSGLSLGFPAALQSSRLVVFGLAMLVVMAFALVQQFLTGRRLLGWSIISGGLALACVVGTVWTGHFRTAKPRHAIDERPEDRAVEIVVPTSFTSFSPNTTALPNLIVQSPASEEKVYTPFAAVFPEVQLTFLPAANWGHAAGLRALGLEGDSGPVSWQLVGRGPGGKALTAAADGPELRGSLEVWHARVRIVGETPLRRDGTFAGAAEHTRIAALERHEGRLDAIFLEEHAPFLWSRDERPQGGFNAPGLKASHVDRYFLVQQQNGQVQSLSSGELGGVAMNGVLVRYRRLFVAGTNDWTGAALVKVRIERLSSFRRVIAIKGINELSPAGPR